MARRAFRGRSQETETQVVARLQRKSSMHRSTIGNLIERDWFTIFGKKYVVENVERDSGSTSLTLHLDGDVNRVVHVVVDTDTPVAFMRPNPTGE